MVLRWAKIYSAISASVRVSSYFEFFVPDLPCFYPPAHSLTRKGYHRSPLWSIPAKKKPRHSSCTAVFYSFPTRRTVLCRFSALSSDPGHNTQEENNQQTPAVEIVGQEVQEGEGRRHTGYSGRTPVMTSAGLPWGISPFVPQAVASRMFALRLWSAHPCSHPSESEQRAR